MQWLRKAGGLGLVLMLALAPVATCSVPFAELTPAERECCRIMPADCGQGHMLEAHACCRTTARTDTVVFAAAKSFTVAPPLESGSPMDAPAVSPEAGLAAADGIFSTTHSPPESPPASVTVLRI